MKSKLTIWLLAIAAGVYSAGYCLAQPVDEDKDKKSDNTQTQEQQGQDPRGPWGQRGGRDEQGMGRPGMGGPGGGPEMGGPGMGGMGGGPGMGSDGYMMGGRGGMGRGMWKAMTSDELIKFFEKYDPARAKQLKDMLADQPKAFQETVNMISELYTPAARLMEFDEEAGIWTVKSISLQLDIKKQVADYKAMTDDKKAKLKPEIRVNLGKQFDLILEGQQADIDMWKERLAEFEKQLQGGQGANGGPGGGFGPGPGFGPFGPGSGGGFGPGSGDGFGPGGQANAQGGGRGVRIANVQARMKKEFDKRVNDIAKWKTQKEQIVDRQLSDLLEDVRPFPWDNW